jgi:hypothetical protein
MTPVWFIPVLVLAQSKPLPLHLATPASAQFAVAPPVALERGRDMTMRINRYLTPMEFRVHQAKYLNASPAPACNGNVCAIPVLQSLANNPYAP